MNMCVLYFCKHSCVLLISQNSILDIYININQAFIIFINVKVAHLYEDLKVVQAVNRL